MLEDKAAFTRWEAVQPAEHVFDLRWQLGRGSSEGKLASCPMSAILSTVPASAPKKCAREGHDEAWTGDVPVLHRRNRAGVDIRLCGELSLAQAALS